MRAAWAAIVLSLLPVALLAQKKTADIQYSELERKAIRREMIEADIAVRTIGSLLAMGQYKEIERQFMLLSRYQIGKHPELKGALDSAAGKWRSAGLEKHFTTLQKIAADARNEVKGKSAGNFPWSKTENSYLSIVRECRACHDATGAGLFEGS